MRLRLGMAMTGTVVTTTTICLRRLTLTVFFIFHSPILEPYLYLLEENGNK